MTYKRQCRECPTSEIIRGGVKPKLFNQHKSGYIELDCKKCKNRYRAEKSRSTREEMGSYDYAREVSQFMRNWRV